MLKQTSMVVKDNDSLNLFSNSIEGEYGRSHSFIRGRLEVVILARSFSPPAYFSISLSCLFVPSFPSIFPHFLTTFLFIF